MSLFLKLFDETQIPTPPEATRHHNSIKLLITLPLRADLLLSVHSETPCRKKFLNIHEMIEFLYRYTLTSVLIKMSLSDL